MTGELAQRMAATYDDWNRSDEDALRARDPVPAEFEFHPPPDLPGVSVYRGPEALREFKRAVDEAFGTHRIEVISVRQAGERVMSHVRMTATGRSSGADISRDEYHVATFAGGIPVSVHCFNDADQALALLESG